jgi:glycerol uptake facilitator protein
MKKRVGLWQACLAEAFGTFVLVLFGTGVVFVAVLTDAVGGLWQVAIVWAIAIALAIYTVGAISGAHINPAVTLSVAAWRRFPWSRVGPYIAAQVVGAFCASAVLFALFCNALTHFERDAGIVRGSPGSQQTAMCFGEYFPNPGAFGTTPADFARVQHWQAMLAEALGTALLVFFVFALTDRRNTGRPDGTLPAVLIGLTVAIIIMIIAPLTQAALNPARDFGPRLFAWLAGWGTIAIPGPRAGFFTVYILSPLVGGVIGGGAYQLGFQRSPRRASVAAADSAPEARLSSD